MYLPMYPFHARTARPISTKFCTDLPNNSGKVLNTSMTLPTQPLDPGVPQTLKPKWVMGEKTLCSVKCPDGWHKLIKFFPGHNNNNNLVQFRVGNELLTKIIFIRVTEDHYYPNWRCLVDFLIFFGNLGWKIVSIVGDWTYATFGLS